MLGFSLSPLANSNFPVKTKENEQIYLKAKCYAYNLDNNSDIRITYV